MKRIALIIIVLVSGLVICCGDDDSDSDTDADSDSDGDTDTDPDTSWCDTIHEVRQPGTDLCWRRCPLGQTWDGDSCEGTWTVIWKDWCDASGQTATGCTPDNPGQDICELTLGGGFRLPTAEEFSVLLEESGLGWYDGKECDGGDGATICTGMFGYDSGLYWSSSPGGDDYAWDARFNVGYVDILGVDRDHSVRCVRSGP